MEPWLQPSEDDHRRLLRVRDAIDRDPVAELDVSGLARVACMSPSHFSRSFRQAFGETPHRYRQRRRLERAMRLLRETGMPVWQVAFEVGWSSLGSFTSTFTRVVGTPPSRYRAQTQPTGDSVPGCVVTRWARPSSFEEDGSPAAP